jgi:hypothetical protein
MKNHIISGVPVWAALENHLLPSWLIARLRQVANKTGSFGRDDSSFVKGYKRALDRFEKDCHFLLAFSLIASAILIGFGYKWLLSDKLEFDTPVYFFVALVPLTSLSIVFVNKVYQRNYDSQWLNPLHRLEEHVCKNTFFLGYLARKRSLLPGYQSDRPGIFVLLGLSEQEFREAFGVLLYELALRVVCVQDAHPEDPKAGHDDQERIREAIDVLKELGFHDGDWNPAFDMARAELNRQKAERHNAKMAAAVLKG